MLVKVIITSLRRCYRYMKGIVRREISSALKGYSGDKKLGIDTGYYNENISQNIYGDSVRYEPTSYAVIQSVIEYLKFDKDDVFIDYGCGKGRIISSIATQKLKKIIGIELDETMINIAQKNIRNLKFKNTPVELFNIDSINFNPIEGNIFFMFNPFGEKTLNIVLNNINNSLRINPRSIRIVYHNSVGESILEKLDWLEFEGKIEDSSYATSVWRNKLPSYKLQQH